MVAVTMPEPMCLVNQLRPVTALFGRCDRRVRVRIVCEYFRITRSKQVEPVHLRSKISNRSKRFNQLIKILDHGIGVRIPASQPFASACHHLPILSSVGSSSLRRVTP